MIYIWHFSRSARNDFQFHKIVFFMLAGVSDCWDILTVGNYGMKLLKKFISTYFIEYLIKLVGREMNGKSLICFCFWTAILCLELKYDITYTSTIMNRCKAVVSIYVIPKSIWCNYIGLKTTQHEDMQYTKVQLKSNVKFFLAFFYEINFWHFLEMLEFNL